MTGMKKTLTGVFVNFPSEIRECPLFAFSEEQKPCKKGPLKKGVKKGPFTVFFSIPIQFSKSAQGPPQHPGLMRPVAARRPKRARMGPALPQHAQLLRPRPTQNRPRR